MGLEFIDELENKIDGLINSFQSSKNEHQEQITNIQSLEEENTNLKTELDRVNNELSENRTQLTTAVDKIKNLLNKLEQVE